MQKICKITFLIILSIAFTPFASAEEQPDGYDGIYFVNAAETITQDMLAVATIALEAASATHDPALSTHFRMVAEGVQGYGAKLIAIHDVTYPKFYEARKTKDDTETRKSAYGVKIQHYDTLLFYRALEEAHAGFSVLFADYLATGYGPRTDEAYEKNIRLTAEYIERLNAYTQMYQTYYLTACWLAQDADRYLDQHNADKRAQKRAEQAQ